MTQQDPSSPDNRLRNISRGKFVRAYAELHGVILNDAWRDKPISDMRLICEVIDAQLARLFDIRVSTLREMLVEVTSPELLFKTGQEQPE